MLILWILVGLMDASLCHIACWNNKSDVYVSSKKQEQRNVLVNWSEGQLSASMPASYLSNACNLVHIHIQVNLLYTF